MNTQVAVLRNSRTARATSLVRQMYEGNSNRARWFRYGLLLFDVTTIIFLPVISFIEHSLISELIDAMLGIIILGDFVARLSLSRHRIRELIHPLGLADIAVIISFLAPIAGQGLGFLRVLRALRLFRSYRTTRRMKMDFPFVQRHYDTIVAGTHLFVFVFLNDSCRL